MPGEQKRQAGGGVLKLPCGELMGSFGAHGQYIKVVAPPSGSSSGGLGSVQYELYYRRPWAARSFSTTLCFPKPVVRCVAESICTGGVHGLGRGLSCCVWETAPMAVSRKASVALVVEQVGFRGEASATLSFSLNLPAQWGPGCFRIGPLPALAQAHLRVVTKDGLSTSLTIALPANHSGKC
eukprot:RCo049691